MSKIYARFTLTFAVILLLVNSARSEIPASARSDHRFSLGYLVVSHYPGVKNDGTGDSTQGIQTAIDDAFKNDLTLLFPKGEYLISDSLRCYKYQLWSKERAERFGDSKKASETPEKGNHTLIGEATERPIIRLVSNAKGFGDTEDPRPMIAFRNYRALTPAGTKPSISDNPMREPEGFGDATANLFGELLCNIDFDCGGNSGAIGVSMPTAQVSTLANVRVNAQGAYSGFHGIPGRNSISANIEVNGGKFGLIAKGSLAGAVIAGIKLYDQTDNALVLSDFCPIAIVGFEIRKSTGPAITAIADKRMANGSMSLMDGRIEVESGTAAIDNSAGKALYLRNVFVRSSQAILQSGSQKPMESAEGWNHIEEYAYTDQSAPAQDDPPYELGDSVYRMFSVIDGKLSQDPQPLLSVNPNPSDPPEDLLSRHVWDTLPLYTGEEDNTVIVTSDQYGATPDDGSDDLTAIQKAIDEASAAGHGRVFIPKGKYLIGNTLVLKSNTVLMGAGGNISEIAAHPSWIPAAGKNAILVQAVDDPAATTALGFTFFTIPHQEYKLTPEEMLSPLPIEKIPPRNLFTLLQWRAGKNSMTFSARTNRDWPKLTQSHIPGPLLHFTGNGGGRHYGLQPRAQSAHKDNRGILIEGTNEPLAFYGLNSEKNYSPDKSELDGGNPNRWLDANAVATNIEIIDSSNVRLYSIKREGSSPTLIVRDSHNIALFASGAMRNPTHPNMGGYLQIFGNSSDILISTVVVQHVKSLDKKNGADEEPLLLEQIEGQPLVRVSWPESLSIYKRGGLDDSMFRREPPTTASSRPQN